ncbi:unnamed protein product [Oppiella nova]|uniref:POU domain protein n=1 Tax=Oppiella nova TaxID=334625 RepID=A0A7R9LBH9_9ACAR|nr:unnamed protein product [Oppiella nova]CAG2161741.1 unnamed protein product [Oppiella nova]
MNNTLIKTTSPNSCFATQSVGSPSRTFSPPSPYTPTTIHHRDMRRHCPSMTPNPHHTSPIRVFEQKTNLRFMSDECVSAPQMALCGSARAIHPRLESVKSRSLSVTIHTVRLARDVVATNACARTYICAPTCWSENEALVIAPLYYTIGCLSEQRFAGKTSASYRHTYATTPGVHTSSTNIFAAAGLDAAAAELHDLSSRNQANIKPDMSSMAYHHHMMQSRQHHPSEMHEFLTADPMSASLPSALGLAQASDASHHPGSSSSAQLHAPSALYSAHSHHHNPMNVNGMIPGLHHQQLASHQMQNPFHHHPHHHQPHHPHHHSPFATASPHHVSADPSLLDADPRELEAFAERFKQRRIKLGVTQADVGKALANLKLPGVGSLSQSTICRFESLTLSHNNMVALKPILQAWLEAAEAQARKNRNNNREGGPDLCVLPSSDKKRKRTSIAAPEKRSLEAYFSVQPRPSGEKIAAIAEKLDLKKNVVRVWFCNQRQKQKRMKYSAVNGPGGQQQ